MREEVSEEHIGMTHAIRPRCYQYTLQEATAGGNTPTVVSDSVIRLITRLNVAARPRRNRVSCNTHHHPPFSTLCATLTLAAHAFSSSLIHLVAVDAHAPVLRVRYAPGYIRLPSRKNCISSLSVHFANFLPEKGSDQLNRSKIDLKLCKRHGIYQSVHELEVCNLAHGYIRFLENPISNTCYFRTRAK